MTYKFKVEIKNNKFIYQRKLVKEYWAVIVARNGEIVFTGETRKRKSPLVKTINNLFPGVVIIDKTTK